MFRFLKYQNEFLGKEVPRPSFWSGFRLIPQHIEFWQRQENRLHVRELYIKEAGLEKRKASSLPGAH